MSLLIKLNNIGKSYNQQQQSFLSQLLHSNEEFADRIASFNYADRKRLRNFVIEIYLALPNTNGQLAKSLRDYMTTDLHMDLSRDLYRYLPLAVLENIGTKYLTKYPRSGFFSHHHQPIAKALQSGRNYQKHYQLTEKSSYTYKWLALMAAYASLHDPFGELANEIERVTLTAFGNNVRFYKSDDNQARTMRHPNKIAKEVLKLMIRTWSSAPKPCDIELAVLRRA